jgi:hypothetical protein
MQGRFDMTRLMMAAALAVALVGCDDSTGPGNRDLFTFSFEDDLDGWQAKGIDLDDPPVTWSIAQSEDTSTVGDGSAKYALDNMNDAGKIFLQRTFELDPDTEYDVRIEFDFATADWGDMNHWRIIAGAHRSAPEDADDLEFQGEAANGEDEDGDHVWLEKRYDVEATSDEDGNIVIAIGVWGTFEVERSYYIDDVRITFTER